MAERGGPQVYSIAAHRGFADALVAGLVPRYGEDEFGLARLTLLLPSRRAIRTVTEAFIRHSGESGAEGLLMPRMAVVGDLDLDETLGPLLDPLGSADIPPAVEPTRRWLRLAELVQEERPELAGAPALRMARQIARSMDRLLVEDIRPEAMFEDRVLDLLGDLAEHWRASLHLFMRVQAKWLAELQARGELDASARRNRLFDHAARSWKTSPPESPIVAVGVTSAAPALARLLRVVSELPQGAVILPDFDLQLAGDVWDELGAAGSAPEPGAAPFGPHDAVTHPQYHLKLLLNRMGIARGEVRPWHRKGMAAARPDRSHAISSLFLPPEASKGWAALDSDKRRLTAVRLMESSNPEEEAQAIALLVRQALEEPEKRVAVVTADRSLALRVSAHLRRWNVEADDTAGEPLAQTAAARVLLLLAELAAEQVAPVPLMALLGHPLVGVGDGAGEGRLEWLERVRELELRLRGPRLAPGLEPLEEIVGRLARKDVGFTTWWQRVVSNLSPLLEFPISDPCNLSALLDGLCHSAEALCGEALWGREDGRALSQFVADLRQHAEAVGTELTPRDLPAVLREAMEQIAVRPPWGGHPRVALYGLLEARMTRAELVICAGLNEGSWPQAPAPDPLLAPPVLRTLGVPGAEFRIGLAAHDLAGMLGAPEVVLSRSARDAAGPAIPSRFLLRVKALLGELAVSHEEAEAVEWARRIDLGEPAAAYPRPMPMPNAEQRAVNISVTALDRLRGDPYQFYAQAILGLRSLDPLDAVPSAAWQGTAAHKVLEEWHKIRRDDPAAPLAPIADQVLDDLNAHPVMRGLWRPRLLAALEWIEERVDKAGNRTVQAIEQKGEFTVDGVRIHGRADRIDVLPDGELAIVDYKTGTPPSGTMVEKGFALQLGLVGLMARAGGIPGVAGDPTRFEYWSLGKNKDGGFGYMAEPVKEGRKKTGLEREQFLEKTDEFVRDAIHKWIQGEEPFTARLNPDYPAYNDYDQLMRLEEWQARQDGEGTP